MILTDYFTDKHDLTWDYAKQCGVKHGVIRLPEDKKFDITDFSCWKSVHQSFLDFGIKPLEMSIKGLRKKLCKQYLTTLDKAKITGISLI